MMDIIKAKSRHLQILDGCKPIGFFRSQATLILTIFNLEH